MVRLPVPYPGFKLGVRVADSMALALDVKQEKDVKVLHKLKNLAGILEGMRRLESFSVNGVTYAK